MTRTALGNWKEPFRNPGFTLYWTALVATGFAIQIQTVAVGWKVYDTTRDPFDLGLVGCRNSCPRCCWSSSPAPSPTASPAGRSWGYALASWRWSPPG